MILSAANEKIVADTGYRPDGQWHDVWVEVKFETHGIRNLRASLLGLAYKNPGVENAAHRSRPEHCDFNLKSPPAPVKITILFSRSWAIR